MDHTPKSLDACHTILQLRELARRRLPWPIFQYLDGAAETEFTARRNTSAFDDQQLIPRCLVDVTTVKTGIRLLGQQIEWPVFCSPTGASRIYHAEGELAVARAAARAGTFYSLSVAATHSLESVATTTTGPKLFQLLIFKDRGLTRNLIERCREARYQALVVTVDAAARGKRDRELRHGMGVPPRLRLASLAQFALRPGWLLGLARTGPLELPNLALGRGKSGIVADSLYLGEQLDPSVSWPDVQRIIALWQGPFALKGIMSVEDACREADIGVTAIIVSRRAATGWGSCTHRGPSGDRCGCWRQG